MNSLGMSRLRRIALAAMSGALFMVLSQSASAVVILSQVQIDPGGVNLNIPFVGQSVITGAGGPWNNIEFNFISQANAVAAGNLFILTQEYLGTPAGLDSGTAGFLAQSSGVVAGRWIFDPSVLLQPLTTYWLLMDDTVAMGVGLFFRTNADLGSALYRSNDASSNYAIDTIDLSYALRGDLVVVAAVPEPATFGLLGIGLLALGLASRRKAHSAAPVDTL